MSEIKKALNLAIKNHIESVKEIIKSHSQGDLELQKELEKILINEWNHVHICPACERVIMICPYEKCDLTEGDLIHACGCLYVGEYI